MVVKFFKDWNLLKESIVEYINDPTRGNGKGFVIHVSVIGINKNIYTEEEIFKLVIDNDYYCDRKIENIPKGANYFYSKDSMIADLAIFLDMNKPNRHQELEVGVELAFYDVLLNNSDETLFTSVLTPIS